MIRDNSMEVINSKIVGASYIGSPKPYTVMFISKKVERLIENLALVENCLVFAENGIFVPSKIQEKNFFVFSNEPQRDYAEYVWKFFERKVKRDSEREIKLTEKGYYVGENVRIGENAYIEPGCLIGHDVIIGKNARILSGTIIKNSIIGDDFVANEYAVIGASGFTITKDRQGNNLRIPTLGNVAIGNCVEIGTHNNISCGSGGNTIIEDYVKLDAFVHVGHDARLRRNAEITANVTVGGFVDMGENTYAGIGSVIRNRVCVGNKTIIGMGAIVTKSVADNVTVIGNPARVMMEE